MGNSCIKEPSCPSSDHQINNYWPPTKSSASSLHHLKSLFINMLVVRSLPIMGIISSVLLAPLAAAAPRRQHQANSFHLDSGACNGPFFGPGSSICVDSTSLKFCNGEIFNDPIQCNDGSWCRMINIYPPMAVCASD